VNPAVVSEPQWDSPRTRQLFWRACADCHSNETVWPWYTRLPIAGQLIRYDVLEGRSRLNVSEWGQRRNETREAVEILLEGEMPPGQYLLLHPAARLTDTEKQELADGMRKSFGR
jgi:mono/diheme cytochrome c family protein